ncbi:hypothetical protein J2T14_000061 [Paenibacillus harenae]|nr:hypothetical protein [Paenibacillus harenae]
MKVRGPNPNLRVANWVALGSICICVKDRYFEARVEMDYQWYLLIAGDLDYIRGRSTIPSCCYAVIVARRQKFRLSVDMLNRIISEAKPWCFDLSLINRGQSKVRLWRAINRTRFGQKRKRILELLFRLKKKGIDCYFVEAFFYCKSRLSDSLRRSKILQRFG